MSIHNIAIIATAYETYCLALEERLGKSLDELNVTEVRKLIGEESDHLEDGDGRGLACAMILLDNLITKFGSEALEKADV